MTSPTVDAADRQEIVDLTIAYTWALDNRHFEGLRQVFTPDATADLRGIDCNGVDAIIARISGALVRFEVTQHLIGNHQVRVNGDTAECRCQLHAQHIRHGIVGGHTFVVGGVYEDQLVRTQDGWRISHRVMRETWKLGNEAILARPT